MTACPKHPLPKRAPRARAARGDLQAASLAHRPHNGRAPARQQHARPCGGCPPRTLKNVPASSGKRAAPLRLRGPRPRPLKEQGGEVGNPSDSTPPPRVKTKGQDQRQDQDQTVRGKLGSPRTLKAPCPLRVPGRRAAAHSCYRPRYLSIRGLNYLGMIRHRLARIAACLITWRDCRLWRRALAYPPI